MSNRFLPPRDNDSSPTSAAYEFSAGDNEIFVGLSRTMKFVGIILILYGVILVVSGIHSSMKLEDLLTIGQGLAMTAIGSWLASAAGALRDIATTEGNDIGYLMIAMRRLKSVYTLQAWAMGIACVLVAIAMVHALRH